MVTTKYLSWGAQYNLVQFFVGWFNATHFSFSTVNSYAWSLFIILATDNDFMIDQNRISGLTLSAMGGGGQIDLHFEHLSQPNGQAKVAEIFDFSYLSVD